MWGLPYAGCIKVLVVHNRYRSETPSGENEVVDADIAMLRARGVAVEAYLRSSDEIDGFSLRERSGLAIRPVWSRADLHALDAFVDRFRPDVMHLHNPYPLISPGAVRVAKRHRVGVVQTVHNYRHVCSAGTYFRDGAPCRDCAGRRFPWPAVIHGCYRGSRIQSVPIASSIAIHRATWQLVDAYLPLTEFLADHLREAGIDPHRITVKPNAVDDPGPSGPPGTGLVYCGRLDEEKGVGLLLAAWRLIPESRSHLVIVGDGPLRGEVERLAAERNDVEFVGIVPAHLVSAEMRKAAVVVVPSLCFEGFPRVIAEAFANSRAVVATDTGAMSTIVGERRGWICQPNPVALSEAMLEAVDGAVAERGRIARATYEEAYHPDVVGQQLIDVFSRLVATR